MSNYQPNSQEINQRLHVLSEAFFTAIGKKRRKEPQQKTPDIQDETAFMAPNNAQLIHVKKNINARICDIDANQKHRFGAYPYYQFHPPEKQIFGTVIIFHDFSAIPHQMSLLAEYLFRNQFNIYQPSLAGHVFIPPSQFWPQVNLKPEIAAPVREKLEKDAVFQNYLTNRMAKFDKICRPSYQEQVALIERLLKIEPSLEDIIWGIDRDNQNDLNRYFDRQSENYLTDARSRLQELAEMPGPIYAIGLGVGASVALALAGEGRERINKVVAFSPLLKVRDRLFNRFLHLAGLLDIQETGWEKGLSFPICALTAAADVGSLAMKSELRRNLWQVPSFFVLTENDDIADIETSKKFMEAIGGEWKGHRCYVYPVTDLVPRQMVDPRRTINGASNRFWGSLYRETLRFLRSGEISDRNMSSFTEDRKNYNSLDNYDNKL